MARWKMVCNGYYSVSDDGQICRLRGDKGGQVIKPWLGRGRMYVTTSINGEKRIYLLAQLIAEAFLGCCPPHRRLAYRDGNRMNVALTNLYYAPRSKSIQLDRAVAHLRVAGAAGLRKTDLKRAIGATTLNHIYTSAEMLGYLLAESDDGRLSLYGDPDGEKRATCTHERNSIDATEQH